MHPTPKSSLVNKAALVIATFLLALTPGSRGAAFARAAPTPEQVVLAHAEAWSNGDLPGLLALLSEDVRIFQRPTDPHKLSGELSDAIGSKNKLADYFETVSAKSPLAREKVIEMATVGDVVIAAGESANPPNYAPGMKFLTAYRVRNGQIHDLWHIAWIPDEVPVGPDPAEVIRQLIAANNARDADHFLALFSPDAKTFRYSDDPRGLADTPSRTLVDAASREAFFRDYFAGAPAQVEAVALFSVGDLVVEQSHVTGFADAPKKIVNQVSIYRVRDGRITEDWLLGEEMLEAHANGATRRSFPATGLRTARRSTTDFDTSATGAAIAASDTETVVLKDFEALSAGDAEGLATLFAPRIEIYGLPTEAHTLVGARSDRMRTREELRAYFEDAFVAEPPMRHEVLEMVSLDDLAVVRVAMHVPDGTPPEHAFTAFRVRNGLIESIWHIAREPGAAPQSGTAAIAAIRQLGEANNRGDADAVVALYHPDAKHSHARHNPAKLGGAPPARVIDQASRTRFYRELYAGGAPTQVDLVYSVGLGEWAATRERYTAPGSPPRDHLTIYRVREGLIIDEWHLAP